jgi:hypothetical protein
MKPIGARTNTEVVVPTGFQHAHGGARVFAQAPGQGTPGGATADDHIVKLLQAAMEILHLETIKFGTAGPGAKKYGMQGPARDIG